MVNSASAGVESLLGGSEGITGGISVSTSKISGWDPRTELVTSR
jgi:hypothetical protein